MATAAPAAKTVLYASTPQFQPPVTGEEICTSLGPVVQHVDAIVPKGRDTWEVHVTDRDVATGLEITGFRLRGRNIELSQRYPGGTWVRVRGFPLEIDNTKVDAIFKNFGAIVAGPFHATWRGTSVKTGDRTIKINLDKDIPQAFSTLEGKVRVTVRYRDQPQTCYKCGLTGHEQKDCTRESYAKRLQEPAPQPQPQEKPSSSSAPDDMESTDSEETKKKEKKEKKKKGKKEKQPDGKRKDLSSPESQPPPEGRHLMPQAIPAYKARKN